ncbi:MAG TPA: A/G-specific adenine glycosylase [Bacteroidia bacterium]|nr:A/G-specific adenine glycosylase [Bacteroidia bacterium]
MNISAILSKWYHKNKRDLPWRHTSDPYLIWLSEIILQQTRVEQGLPYFQKFSAEFPTVKHFAKAHEDKILKMWQGLGYYSRARNMHHAAKEIVKTPGGNFPGEFAELKKLKGVGDYTAAAIASFAFNKPHAVVDGNVYRFLSRYFGIETPIDSPKGKKIFYAVAEELLDKKNPGLHNQAIMEFGARQCRPANPDCANCPLHAGCRAFKIKKVNRFPVKSKTQKIKERFFHYFFIRWKSKVFLHKRTGNDIWKNLYEFPLIETKKKTSLSVLLKTDDWKNIFGTTNLNIHEPGTSYKHQLSHQTIHARFYEIALETKPSQFLRKNFMMTTKSDLEKYGVARLTDKFLKQNKTLNLKL